MGSAKKLVLIDGSALAYRSYFAFIRNPLVNSRGENTSAVFGFANTLLRLLRDSAPDYLAVVFDTAAPTFRHEVFPEYKSTRAKMPDELAESLPRIDELVSAMRLPVLRQDGVEADDIIGTLARRAEAEDVSVLIYSGDKDFCQLVSDRVHVLRPGSRGEEELLDADGVSNRMGVPPDRVIDLLALMGDSSDNVPGIPGVGEKTALKLLGQYESVDGVLDHGEEIKGKLGERVRENHDTARLSRDLVTIRTDLDVDVTIDALCPGEPDGEALVALFNEMEFKGLAASFMEAEDSSVEYTLITTSEELRALVERLRAAGRFAFDTETTSLSVLDARLVGLSFCDEEGVAAYVPVGHESTLECEAVNLPLDDVIEVIRPILEDPEIEKIGQHTKYDASVLLNHGIAVRGIAFDTMLAAYLLDPGKGRYGLDVLSIQELGHKTVSYADLVGTGKNKQEIWQVDLRRVSDYAAEDADVTFRLATRFAPRLEELTLQSLFEDVEMPLSDVLMEMERHGVLIDRAVFDEMAGTLGTQLEAIEAEIHEMAGHTFNIGSPKQLRVVLFEELGLPTVRRTKTGPSTDSDVLERLTPKHPIAEKILDYRQVSKLLSTYVLALPKLAREDTGRVHTSFNQTVAATGRLSSSDPNLQNIPIRTEMGRKIREGFVAPRGWRLLSADYSQVELRVLASIAGDERLREAFRSGLDVHRHTAALVFDVDPDDVTPEMRAQAKTVNFGVIYGQGARGLAAQLGISVADAEEFIEAYFDTYSLVRIFKEETLERARREGYVTTLLGRRRFLPEINSENGQRRSYAERTAVNTVIQGTAADLIKVAMVRIAGRLEREKLKSRMILQVHDELVFEAPTKERDVLEALVKEEMEGALELEVPLVVDAGWGNNWLEAH